MDPFGNSNKMYPVMNPINHDGNRMWVGKNANSGYFESTLE